ncbi:Twinfilin [Penicillium subrubescens]|uniref:Twinfilin n=1 Tax=Penicillium subrubescens TaxID=1316194 RepID=A0A1Q5UHN0_9EURO|nr:Twinfilin [Penicillium subrubescens]
MQSGITVSSELHDAFNHFTTDPSTFCLPVTITGETLTPLTPISFTGSSTSPDAFYTSLSQISSILQPKTPIYLLLRRPLGSKTTLVALTYIPSNAPVRPKMLFASTRSTLVRELGTEKFDDTVFATEEEEIVGREAWSERDGDKAGVGREALMGEKERELEAVRRAEAEARSGTPQRDIGIGGTFGPGTGSGMRVSMPVAEEAKSALKELGDGGLVQLTVDIPTETITLADNQSGVQPDSVATHISSTSPRYSFYHYPGSDVVVFIYTCPTGSSIRERMLHASSRRNAITVAEGEGLKINKKIEASGPDEITRDRLKEEVHPAQDSGPARGFARPRRPGR